MNESFLFKRLLKEIDTSNQIEKSVFPGESIKKIDQNQPEGLFSSKENEIKRWDENQVQNWFKQMKIDSVYDVLKPLDGEILHQLYEFKTYTPELFFKSISKHESIDLKEAAQFSLYLSKLFKSTN